MGRGIHPTFSPRDPIDAKLHGRMLCVLALLILPNTLAQTGGLKNLLSLTLFPTQHILSVVRFLGWVVWEGVFLFASVLMSRMRLSEDDDKDSDTDMQKL